MNFPQFFFALMLCLSPQLAFSKSSTVELPITQDWEMRQTTSDKWSKAVVPGCVHSDLLRNKEIPEPYYRTNEKDLQWIDKKDWEYKTIFEVNNELLKNDHLELLFKGLDTYADVYLNDQKILVADNMFREWQVEVKQFLHLGSNRLRIVFKSPILTGLELLKAHGFVLQATNDQSENGGLGKDELVSPFIRKAPYHFGWDWGPRFVTSGIWKPVFLRAWSEVQLSDFSVQQQSLTDKLALLMGRFELRSTKAQKAELFVFINGKRKEKRSVTLEQGLNILEIPFEIKNPLFWWTNGLGKANLYNITASIQSELSSDSQSREIGLRMLRLVQKPDSAGHSFYFELNGVPVFAKGANHIPNDMFLDRVTKEVYDREIETAVHSNMNMLRVWGGGIYEDDYFYEQCDKKGILVWQDFMFACALYPGNEQFLNSIRQEAVYQVKRLRNHPSMALWCGNNEIDLAWSNYSPTGGWGWKQRYNEAQRKQIWTTYDTIFNHLLADVVKEHAPQTPYWQSSPATLLTQKHAPTNNASGDAHYWGVWGQKAPFEKFSSNIGRFMSEYGFQSFPELPTVQQYALPEDYDIESEVMRHHQRSRIGNATIKQYMNWYYRVPESFEQFLYVGQLLQAYGIALAIEEHRRAMPYNMGSLVWQINDCWPVASWSSTDYYQRWKALQYTISRSFEPILISVFAKGDGTNVSIVCDQLKEITAQMEIKVSDFKGENIYSNKKNIIIKANSVTPVFAEQTASLTNKLSASYMSVVLKNGDVVLSHKNYFFAKPKELLLEPARIVSKIEKDKADWVITLQSDRLAKDVYLSCSNAQGFFSDNYFDLLPGELRTIRFSPSASLIVPLEIKIISLVDSYHSGSVAP